MILLRKSRESKRNRFKKSFLGSTKKSNRKRLRKTERKSLLRKRKVKKRL